MLEDLARIHYRPEMRGARMVLGFSGWMDGGEVSTGTVDYLAGKLNARKLAGIVPGPFYIYMMTCARTKGMPMTSLVVEIPACLQGRNTKGIEAATRKLAALLDLSINLDELDIMSGEFEARLNEAVRERPELGDLVRKMEEDYAHAAREVKMPGLRDWFEKQDIRLD